MSGAKTMHGGTNVKRHRMLCRACNRRYRKSIRDGVPSGSRPVVGRYTLKKHPDKYKQEKRTFCTHCGSDDVRSVEYARRREQNKRDLCYCINIPFPHSPILGCVEHEPDREWTDEDHEQFQSMLDTPRSG